MVKRHGASMAPIEAVDRLVDAGQPAWYLKHDIHGLPLDAMVDFAAEEAEAGLLGTYLFMPPDHPLTARHYDWKQQQKAMSAVSALGHRIGLHIDPYFMMEHLGRPLREIMTRLKGEFEACGVEVVTGNMHGNSKYKMVDRNGFGTSFDLFEEIGRQQDYPALSDVDEAVADVIHRERVSLRGVGFTFWTDMPMWSAKHGFVVTNFLTDNQLARRGTIEVLIHADTIGQYRLADRQPPGSRTPSTPREHVAYAEHQSSDLAPISAHLPFDDEALAQQMQRMAGQAVLMLIHPEHYV